MANPTPSLGKNLGGGVFEWAEGQLIKVYDDGVPADFITYMSNLDRALKAAGLPVAASGELLQLPQGRGQVYERIEGQDIGRTLINGVSADEMGDLARTFAETQIQIHACQELPGVLDAADMVSNVLPRLPLPKELLEPVLQRANKLLSEPRPACFHGLCHGDYHPFNVILSPNGPVVIDWNNSHMGDPLEDVARTRLLFEGIALQMPDLKSLLAPFGQPYATHHETIYCAKHGLTVSAYRDRLDAWRPIVCAIRLADGIEAQKAWLIDEVRRGLH